MAAREEILARLRTACESQDAFEYPEPVEDTSAAGGSEDGRRSRVDQFVELEVGALKLKKGTNRILMRPTGELKGELIDLRSIRLAPEPKGKE